MNRKYFVLFAATSLTVAGAAGVRAQNQPADPAAGQVRQQQQQLDATVRDRSSDAANVAGAQSPYADDIRRVLSRVTEQAVKGDVNDVADNFTTNSKDQFSRYGKHAAETGPNAHADNDQAKKDAKAADDQLKQTSKQFADAWKAKYGHDFNLDRKNEPLVFAGDTFQIMQGDVSIQQQQPRPAAGEVSPSGAQPDANRHPADANLSTTDNGVRGSARIGDTNVSGTAGANGVDINRERNASPNAEQEKRMATVMVKESHGLPAVNLTLVNEGTFGNRWHIQPPPGLDYKTLSTNLNQQLQEAVSMKDQWPQDETEAYKAISHRVLSAIAMPMEKSATGIGSDLNSAQPAGQLQQPSDQSSQQPQLSQPSR